MIILDDASLLNVHVTCHPAGNVPAGADERDRSSSEQVPSSCTSISTAVLQRNLQVALPRDDSEAAINEASWADTL